MPKSAFHMGRRRNGRWDYFYIGDDGGLLKGQVVVSLPEPPQPPLATGEEKSQALAKIRALVAEATVALSRETNPHSDNSN